MIEESEPFNTLHEAAMGMVNEYAEQSGEGFTLFDGFEEALIGMAFRFGGVQAAAYDMEKCLDILKDQGMTEEEAIEYFEFNVIGAWIGDTTPIFVNIPRAVQTRVQ